MDIYRYDMELLFKILVVSVFPTKLNNAWMVDLVSLHPARFTVTFRPRKCGNSLETDIIFYITIPFIKRPFLSNHVYSVLSIFNNSYLPSTF